MDTRRLLIAALLSLAVMIAWGYFFPPPEPPERPQQASPAAERRAEAEPTLEPERAPPSPPDAPTPQPAPGAETEVAAETVSDEATEPIVADAEAKTVVTGEHFRAEFTNRGAQLVSFQLLRHDSAEDGPVDLVRARAGSPYYFGLLGPDGSDVSLNDALFQVDHSSKRSGEEVISYRYRGPAGDAAKRFAFRPDGLLEVDIDITADSAWTVVLGPGIRNPSAEELKSRFARRSVVYRHAEGVERIDPGRLDAPQALSPIGLQWVGLQDTYFLAAAVPEQGLSGVIVQPAAVIPGTAEAGATFRPFRHSDQLSAEEEGLERELFVLLEPQGNRLEAVAMLGAKQYDRLAALPYGLEETVELGWFRFLSLPLLWGLRWIYDNLLANYGWAIILMTVLIRVVLFPLTHKSTVSMQKMQEINPKVQAIRQKYRGKLKDKQGRPNAEMQRKMNEETMALYKAEGVNPAGGCLPMLLQIPVLFAFYNILSTAIEIRHAPWILWIQDLSAKDPLYVLPVVMGATQFLQQKMTPPAGDPMQRRIFSLMPVFFTVLFLGFPSGLVLYWLTNNVLGIGQQYMYKRWREARQEEAKPTSGKSGGGPGKRGSQK